ncbi:MAG TPA: 1-acyl-sn-glycerol-3-phosphate acyltransferase [Nocardioidaceae bacterium]|nr:1-acyl-sn-glycerol-3-phosphate acyltransferase [Nocardioidaceae bacterium]
MADAEIIPIGTRGRPGRGTGNAKPSASARSLAGGAKPKTPSAPKRAAKKPVRPSDVPAGESGPEAPETATPKRTAPKRPRPVAEPPLTEAPAAAADGAGTADSVPGSDRAGTTYSGSFDHEPRATSDTTTRDRALGDGIPAIDWVQAFTFAAKEIFGDDWESHLAEFMAFLRRRAMGDYTVDEYGFDREITERFFYSAIRPIAEKWFRVEVRGADNIPEEGGALVVSNHSGTIPLDGLVTGVSIFDHTGRHLRPLGADLVFRLPIIGELARRGGATLACNEDAERMLRGGELVGVWPEGFKGIGKPYADRYKLQRFGRGGFVSAALRTGVPIIPCSVVGAEEIYPLVGNIPSLARLLGVPYIPITPLFPALGLLGLIPLPSKWLIEFGEPIRTDAYDAGAADDPMLVFNVTDQVRETIQQTLYSLLMQRRSVFH